MFIEKYAERVENYIDRHFHRSPRMNFIYLFIISALEFIFYWFLADSAYSDMVIIKIITPLLLADAFTKYYFACWILFTSRLKENKKWLKAMHYFLLFAAVMFFLNFCVFLSWIFS